MDILDFIRILKVQNSDSEVWWDSSPTVYAEFRKLVLDRYQAVFPYIKQLVAEDILDVKAGISGATTNPKLVTQAVLTQAAVWQDEADGTAPDLPAHELARQLYDQVIDKGARLLHPLWTSSQRRHGWLSAQIDTRQLHSTERMVARGLQLARLSPNVMIKVPGCLTGFQAIRQLVAKGCSINVTLCFSMSQFMAGLAAIQSGRSLARQQGLDVSHARHVITFMIGRFGDEPQFDQQARLQGITLTLADKRWAELAVYQALQNQLRRVQMPVRLLLCSLRVDTDDSGQEFSWHLERTGADTTLYTLTPGIFEFLLRRQASGRPVLPACEQQRVPDDVMDKLLCIPYFTDAYSKGGIDPAAFEFHPAFITARNEACVAHEQLLRFAEGLCGQRINPTSLPMAQPIAPMIGVQ